MRQWIIGLLVVFSLPLMVWAGPQPHDLDIQTKTASVTSDQTAATIWTPASGKAVVIIGGTVSSNHGAFVDLLVGGTTVSNDIYAASGTVPIGGGITPFAVGLVNEVVAWTTVEDVDVETIRVSITLYGYEFDP